MEEKTLPRPSPNRQAGGRDARQGRILGAALLAVVVGGGALLLRWACFHAYADGWDSCEYVWAVSQDLLPHSPYVVFLLLGKLLAVALPADEALSLLSLLSGLASVALLGVTVHRQTGERSAGWLAAASVACFPVCVWFSGLQEVYALQIALVLAAFLSATRPGFASAVLSGLLFGAAVATHSGSLFVAPAFLLSLFEGVPLARMRSRLRDAGLAVGAALVVPLLAAGWLAWLFSRSGSPAWIAEWLRYLRGIAPAPGATSLGLAELAGGAGGLADRALGVTTGYVMVPLLLLVAACVALAALGRGRFLAFWLVFAAPYLAYEIVLGGNLDFGLYSVYVAPAVAALPAGAAGALIARARGEAAGRVAWPFRATGRALLAVGAVVLLAFPAARSASLRERVVSREAFLGTDLLRSCAWIRAHVTPDAFVVEPPGLDNVNLLPCYTGLRPIIFEAGRYLIWNGGKWSPLNLYSFAPLQAKHLERLGEKGIPVVSLVADPFSRQEDEATALGPVGFRQETMRLVGAGGSTWERPLYVLEGSPAAGETRK